LNILEEKIGQAILSFLFFLINTFQASNKNCGFDESNPYKKYKKSQFFYICKIGDTPQGAILVEYGFF